MRRVTAAVLCFSLILTCSGIEPYAAYAGTLKTAPVEALPQAAPLVSVLPVPGLAPAVPTAFKAVASIAAMPPVAVVIAVPAAATTAKPSAAANKAAAPASIAAKQAVVTQAAAALAKPNLAPEATQVEGLKLFENAGSHQGSSEAVTPAGSETRSPASLHPTTPKASTVQKKSSISFFKKAFTLPVQKARRTLAAAALGLMLALVPASVMAQNPPPAQGQVQQQVQPGTTAAQPVEQPIVLSKDLSVSVAYDRQDMKVGERLHMTVTLKNETAKPLVVDNPRAAVEGILPEDMEISDTLQTPALTLAPGESKTLSFEMISFMSGQIKLEGPLTFLVSDAQGVTRELNIALKAQTLSVATVLTPDWKEKGFRDITPVMKREVPEWVWFAALPLLVVLLIGVERFLNARREFPKVPAARIPVVVRARERLAALSGKTTAPQAEFYTEFDDILTRFLVDFHGLSTKERSSEALLAELKRLSSGQRRVTADLLSAVEKGRFSEAAIGDAERRRHLSALSDLIDSIAGKQDGGDKPKPGNDAVLGGAGLSFGTPAALLLFVPLIAHAVWTFIQRRKKVAFTVSDGQALPARRSLRQRLSNLPKILRYLALSAILVGLASPQLGVKRDAIWRPSTDTMIEFDVSGSMDERVGSSTKLEAAGEAVKGYIDEQRRSEDNRVGMGTFSDDPYLDVRLTTDYDALIAHLKELKTQGSTAVGKAILDGSAHFIELNILELGDGSDPRMARVKELLKTEGLAAALEYARSDDELFRKVLRPDRAKVLVLFTDGESNSGISPKEAAEIAASLGVKIYTVFIGPNGGSGMAALQEVSQITGAKFYRAADPAAMRLAMEEVNRLEKSPSRVTSSITVQNYSRWFVLMALLFLGLEVGLSATRLRALNALLIFSLPMGSAGPVVPLSYTQPAAVYANAQAQAQVPPKTFTLSGVPKAVADANLLYNMGRYGEAVKAYDEALKLHPDMPELNLNMGDAYFKLGEFDKAEACYQRFLAQSKDARLQSIAYYNLSMVALAKKDGAQAKSLLKEALRRDAGNEDARWNLEVLNKLQQEQQKDQRGQKGKKGQKGQKGQGQPGEGQPGDGQPGDGQPGDAQGKEGGQPKPGDPKEGAGKLSEKLGEQQKQQDDAARKALPRKGTDAWGGLLFPLAAGGTALTFSVPLWIWIAAIAAPIVALLLAYGIHKRIEAAQALTPGTAPKNFKTWWGRKGFLRKAALVTASVGLLALAAGGPKSGLTEDRLNFGGKDVIVAVDGSASAQYAEDGRFAHTQKELADFAAKLEGTDRVGLVVFAGKPRTASPLSVDYGNFEYKVERLDRESRGLGNGSSLADAVEHAAKSFETAKDIGPRDRVLIIISDGEIFGEDLEAAVQAAQKHQITIYTIGVGTEGGVKMKVPTEDGKGTEYVQDENTGKDALTRLDEKPLRELARRTGGVYFRAGNGAALSRVVEQVAADNQTVVSQTIRSPRDAAPLFLWPAAILLLLDLLLPAGSVLRRPKKKAAEAPAKPADKGAAGGPTKLHGGAIMGLGAALLPLSSWPIVLPFAIAALVVGGILAADLWTGGALSKRVVWALQRRKGVVQKGLLEDLPRLFELRELDDARLGRFLTAWQAASPAVRERMLAHAAEDEELAREMLVLAYLNERDSAARERILAELGRVARRQLKSVSPVLKSIGLQRGKLSWLSHPDVSEPLERLEDAFLEPAPSRISPHTGWRPRARGFGQRLALGAALVITLGSLTLTGVSSYKTHQYNNERAAAADASMKIFFAEDGFIFTDRYVDDRIPTMVLPVLREWSSGTLSTQADLERAIEILATSPDPKADNVLEAILRHSDLLPLNETAEFTLLKTLVLRDNDHVWRFVDEMLVEKADNPRLMARLQKMVAVAIATGDPKAFENAFRFLRSPNDDLRSFTASALYSSLNDPAQGDFYTRLAKAQARFEADPMINLWVQKLVLTHASDQKARGYDAAKAKDVVESVYASARAYDAARAPFLQAAAAAAAQGKKTEALPSLTAALMTMLAQDAAGSPAAADLAKIVVNGQTTAMIVELEKELDGLHEKLIEDGVVLPDARSSYSDYEDRYHGHWGGMYRGSSREKQYREVYKLRHLRALMERIQAESKRLDSTAVTPELAELLTRSAELLPVLEAAGKASGMLDGGSPAEIVADAVNPLLTTGFEAFDSDLGFVAPLRALKLAPDNGAAEGEQLWHEAYTLEQLQALRRHFLDLGTAGMYTDSDGDTAAMSIDQRKFLVGAVSRLDSIMVKSFNQPVPKTTKLPAGLQLADIAVRSERAAGDEAVQRKLLSETVAFLATPAGAHTPVADLQDVLGTIYNGTPSNEGKAAHLKVLQRAAAKWPAELRAAFEARVKDVAASISSALNTAYTPYKDPISSKITIHRLRQVLELGEKVSKEVPQPLSEAQRKSLATARVLVPVLLELAPQAGIGAGNTPGELVADKINPLLYQAYVKFSGTHFKTKLAKAGLAPDNNIVTVEQGYDPSYTKDELKILLQYLQDLRASGQGWEGDGKPRPMTADEAKVLDEIIAAVRESVTHYPGESRQMMRGAALLGLMPLAAVLSGWTVALLALAAVAWFLYKRWSAEDEGVEGGSSESSTLTAGEAAARAKRLEMAARKLASSVAAGSFRSLFIGAGGSDFAESREYQGEDLRDIDWKATAKQGKLYSKKYELEKDIPLMLVIDVSGSGAFGTRGADKRVVIEDVAAVLALAATQLNLRVGAVLVSDKVEAFLPPKSGAGQAHEIMRLLSGLDRSPRRTDLKPGLDVALKELRSRARVLVISDFLAPEFGAALLTTAKRHDLGAIRVSDPSELSPLPDVGLLAVRDGETGDLREVDTSHSGFRSEHAALIQRRESRLANTFSRARLQPLVLSTEGDYLQQLQDAFDAKANATRSTP